MQQLLEKSGLHIDRSSLYRKLYPPKGRRVLVPATTAECEALAKALGITLVYPQPRGRRRKVA